jgi:predicted ATP-grasp superfamily ATP-dependent carboligase
VAIAAFSRYSCGFVSYCCPTIDGRVFLKDVTAAVKRLGIQLVVPVTERTCVPLSLQKAVIEGEAGVIVMVPEWHRMEKAIDKWQTYEAAAKAGVPFPPTAYRASLDQMEACAEEVGFPLVLKDRFSVWWDGRRIRMRPGARYVRTPAELRAAVSRRPADLPPPMAQRYVPGQGFGASFVLDPEGRVRAEFVHRRICDIIPTGGASTLRESAVPDPLLLGHGRRLLAAMDWRGLAMAEFRVDEHTGAIHLMEVNGRTWGSMPLAIAAGVDFPALAAALAVGRRVPLEPPAYRVGLRCEWIGGQVLHCLRVLRGPPPQWAGSYPRFGQSARQFFSFLRGDCRTDVFEWQDPAPAAVEVLGKPGAGSRIRAVATARSHASGRATFFGALHVHSSHSHDGRAPVTEIARSAARAGCRFVYMTEHAEDFTAASFSAYVRDLALASRSGMLLLPGLEYECDGDVHLLAYATRQFFIERDPVRLAEAIRRAGGLAVLAHPGRSRWAFDDQVLRAVAGVEVWNGKRCYDGPAPSRRSIRLLRPGHLAFWGLDAHETWELACGQRLRVKASSLSAEAVDKALRAGRFEACGWLCRIPSDGRLGSWAGVLSHVAGAAWRTAYAALRLPARLLRGIGGGSPQSRSACQHSLEASHGSVAGGTSGAKGP